MMATTNEPQLVHDGLGRAQRGVVRRLERVRRRLRTHLLVEGAFLTLNVVMVAALASFALDRFGRFNLSTRQGLLLIALAAIAIVVVRRLVRPLALPLEDLDLA